MADEDYRLAVVDLLGALAYGELTAFERLADDASFAPTIADKAALAAMAVAEYNHFALLRSRLDQLGVGPEEAMEPFMPALEAFHERTAPSDWLEGLVKAYVGDGIATDFYREVSAYLDDSTRELVLEVLEDTGHSTFAVDRVRAAIAADPRLAGRLALWGRRLVGEALSQAQRVAAERDALAGLLVGGVAHRGADLAEVGRMFARLTENHTRRMADARSQRLTGPVSGGLDHQLAVGEAEVAQHVCGVGAQRREVVAADPLQRLQGQRAVGQGPGRGRPAAHQCERPEQAVRGHDPLVLADPGRPGDPAEQQRVVRPEQPRWRHSVRRVTVGEVDQPVRPVDGLVADRGQPSPGRAEGDAGPAREVVAVRRSVTLEVAPRQPGQGVVGVQRRGRLAQPVGHRRKCLLAAVHRPAHHVSPQGRGHQHVDEGLPCCRHPRGVQPLAQLGPGERPVLRDRRRHHLDALLGLPRRDALLCQPAGRPGGQLRRRERVQPPVVLCGDQVQGAAVEPAHHEGTVVQRRLELGCAQSGRPAAHAQAGTARVLRLHGEQSTGDLCRRPGRRAGQQLGP